MSKKAKITNYNKKKKTTLQHLKLGELKFGIQKNWVFDELNKIFKRLLQHFKLVNQ